MPERLYDKQWKKMALEDALIRIFASGIRKYSFQAKGSGKSGLIRVTNCGQEVLERTAADGKTEPLFYGLKWAFRQMEER